MVHERDRGSRGHGIVAGVAKRAAGLLVALVVLAGCPSGSEKFCTLGLVMPFVEVDVTGLPPADEVCVDDEGCVPVADGIAELREPLIANDTSTVVLSVRDGGTVLADAAVRLPRVYGNGFECDGDGPGGTVTFGADGGVGVTADVDGTGNTR